MFLACHSSTGHIQHVAFNFRALQRFGRVTDGYGRELLDVLNVGARPT